MKIETKFNIGDEVFILMSKKVEKYPVTGIKIDVNGTSIYTKYRLYNDVGHTDYFDENDLFPSKEELLKSL